MVTSARIDVLFAPIEASSPLKNPHRCVKFQGAFLPKDTGRSSVE